MKPKTIYWRDASRVGINSLLWFTLEEAKEQARKEYEDYCVTVGFILHETKDYIIIGATKSGEVYGDISMIPKCLIFKRKKPSN